MYTMAYPERWVYFEGSTAARTRLYRMAISLNFDELSSHLDIFGVLGDGQAERLSQASTIKDF